MTKKGHKLTRNPMTNHIIAPVHDRRNQELQHIIKNNVNILVAVQTHVIVQFTKTVQCSIVSQSWLNRPH